MRLISGSDISRDIYSKLEKRISTIPENDRPSLHIIVATHDQSAHKYSQLKMKKAASLGLTAQIHEFGEESSATQIREHIEAIVMASKLNGVMVQLPLFPHLEPHQTEILNAIPASQDVDGIGATNLGLTAQNSERAIWPATVAAVWECMLMNVAGHIQHLKGKHAVIINHSNVVGKPLAQVLLAHEMTVTICHEYTIDLAKYTTDADYLITATGQIDLLNHTHIKPEAVVIDVTSISTPRGVYGDVQISNQLDNKISARTPVPGGVGPVTVACLMRNLVHLSFQTSKY